MTHSNSIPMTRILSEDVGTFDLFTPGTGFKRAQARRRTLRTFIAPAIALLAVCRQWIDRVAA